MQEGIDYQSGRPTDEACLVPAFFRTKLMEPVADSAIHDTLHDHVYRLRRVLRALTAIVLGHEFESDPTLPPEPSWSTPRLKK